MFVVAGVGAEVEVGVVSFSIFVVVGVVEWVWVGRSGLLDGEEEGPEGEREVKASETERRV